MTALQRTIAVDNRLAMETLISPSGLSEIREHSEETNWHRLVRTPLKFGMEYLELDLRDVGPSPWHLKLEEEALAIGFVSKTSSQISLPESELERIDSGHWFRQAEMIIDQTSHAGHASILSSAQKSRQLPSRPRPRPAPPTPNRICRSEASVKFLIRPNEPCRSRSSQTPRYAASYRHRTSPRTGSWRHLLDR